MDAYIIDGVFTPRASVRKGVSAYSSVHPQELFATCLRALRDRQPEAVEEVDSVYVGCVSQVGDQGANLARNAVLAAGFSQEVSAVSLNMCCGSGLEAIKVAAASVASGLANVSIAGGVESMSRVQMASDGGGMDGNNTALRQSLYQVPQGISADFIATTDAISRDELEQFALTSHKNAAAAREQKYFSDAYALVKNEDGATLLTDDDHIRSDANLDSLRQLQPAFQKLGAQLTEAGIIGQGKAIGKIEHVHTAGTSSGIADGAAAVVLANRKYIEKHGLKPRAQVIGIKALGSDPITMLTGPADCCLELLKAHDMTPQDVDLWEINEAFAVVPLQTIRRLGIEPAKVNVKGGAIAKGHPLGATGAILLTSMVTELEKENKQIGCVVLCVAGGQSIAALIKRC